MKFSLCGAVSTGLRLHIFFHSTAGDNVVVECGSVFVHCRGTTKNMMMVAKPC